jgi:hypothetical protein
MLIGKGEPFAAVNGDYLQMTYRFDFPFQDSMGHMRSEATELLNIRDVYS